VLQILNQRKKISKKKISNKLKIERLISVKLDKQDEKRSSFEFQNGT
jgi:hypothetical protein